RRALQQRRLYHLRLGRATDAHIGPPLRAACDQFGSSYAHGRWLGERLEWALAPPHPRPCRRVPRDAAAPRLKWWRVWTKPGLLPSSKMHPITRVTKMSLSDAGKHRAVRHPRSRDVIENLNRTIREALQTAPAKSGLARLVLEVEQTSPSEFARLIRTAT